MSHKALLFCLDEATARPVTQVLSELDFTVEPSFEPFVTVKKLADESFDALVVDCTDEQNAALLFKGARNSALNHSSLCVAVAEGQAGVAKAFRIGANLVLTKPINIEQSKGTLKVAKGLLRKGDPKTRSAASEPATPAPSATTSVSAPPLLVPASVAPAIAAAAASAAGQVGSPMASAPSSLFEAEQKKVAPTEPTGKTAPNSTAAFVSTRTTAKEEGPIAAVKNDTPRPVAFSGSAAAAPALAPIEPDSKQTKGPAKWAPVTRTERLAITDAIVPDKHYAEAVRPLVPTFSSYAERPAIPRNHGSKGFWVTLCFVIFGSAGYFGWQTYQPIQYLPHPTLARSIKAASPGPSSDTEGEKPSPAIILSPSDQQSVASPNPSSGPADDSSTGAPPNSAPEGFPTGETLVVGEPTGPITVTSKPEPLHVKQKPATAPEPTPPALELPTTDTSDSVLSGLVATNIVVPKAEPGTVRLSQGITQGLLIKKVTPTYPQIALQLRKQGNVELLAGVSKTGVITKIKVLSGDGALAQAAVSAVRQWTYRPYLLNGEPVEIETQITIVFKLP